MTISPATRRDAAKELRGLVGAGASLRRHPVLFILSGVLIQVLAMLPVSLIEGHRELDLAAGSVITLVAVLGAVFGGVLAGVALSVSGGAAYMLLAARPLGAEGVWVQFVPLVICLVLAVIAGLASDALRRRTEDALGQAAAREREIRRTLAEVAAARRAIQELALHDELTGLPNRRLFNDRFAISLAQAHRNGEVLAVLFVDCDNFKAINDELGHHGGDLFLRRLALRLKTVLREGDTLARFGGDEFTLLLPGIGLQEEAEAVAARVLAELRRPFDINGHEIAGSASIGIAVYPRDGRDQSGLMFAADRAMYHVKQHGRSGFASGDEEDALLVGVSQHGLGAPRADRVGGNGDHEERPGDR